MLFIKTKRNIEKVLGKKDTICDITSDEAKERYEKEKDTYLWLDVRTLQEYKGGHVPNATHIPIDQLESRISELPDKEKKYIVYCAAGGRSLTACKFMEAQGFKYLYNMTGGMNAWSGPLE